MPTLEVFFLDLWLLLSLRTLTLTPKCPGYCLFHLGSYVSSGPPIFHVILTRLDPQAAYNSPNRAKRRLKHVIYTFGRDLPEYI